jgi:hypothetical protein
MAEELLECAGIPCFDDDDTDSGDEELLASFNSLFGATWSRRRRKRIALWMKHQRQRGVRSPKRKFPRMDWKERTENFLTAKEFRKLYKLDRPNFKRVLTRIVPHMKKADPSRDGEPAVPYELELACTMRWLAGGNYLDIHHHHGISETALWGAIHRCIYALLIEYGSEQLGDDKFLDPTKLYEIERTFAAANGQTIRGCVGAIDGCAIRINRPGDHECDNPSSYYSRKGFYALVLQAICDGNCKFLWGSVRCAGGTHDSTSWSITELCRCVFELCLLYIYHYNSIDSFAS